MIDLNQMSHSQDFLEIINNGQISCVKKTFTKNISRASLNVAKQRNFKPLYTGSVRIAAAEVIDFKINESHAELFMPYVDGMTGSMLPALASRQMAHTLSAALSTLLFSELNDSTEQLVPSCIFTDKLKNVLSETKDLELRTLLERANKLTESLPFELIFPIGRCHGDLTLSNLILDPVSGLTLIDFLETYLETPLQDVSKLKQDFNYGWSFRNESPAIAIKAEILCRKHYPNAITQIERLYPMQIKVLTLLTLARIAPYVQDQSTKNWLCLSMEKCMREYK
jgi:hypothetical protein